MSEPFSRSIAGRVAIVTGAASGMGRATALLFAREGAAVGLLDRDDRRLAEVTDTARANGGVVHPVVVDLAETSSIASAVADVRSALGPIDILVNNAGMPSGVTFDAPEFEDVWARTFAINLTAYVAMVRACLDDLLRDRAGRIVNIASTEGLGATPRTSPYTASKHGVVGLTRSLAVELGRRGVTANCICPGPIRTQMTAGIPEDAKDQFARRRVPVGRYGEPEEVAHVILSLVLPAASFLNGAIIPVDGGMTASSR
ncbi:MAG TPA: SDR family oxidoreductase [Acidimicrobiales bacterium]|nr:SDR family oxidoreductase [Acidimicrobiales bacterium]